MIDRIPDGYTPGPWEAEPALARGSWISGSDGEWAALACGRDDDTAARNARLIALAPEMADEIRRLTARVAELEAAR